MYKKEALEKLIDYERDMKEEELSERTIKKYLFDITQWLGLQNECIDMESMIVYKRVLVQRYAVSSINSKLISINRYLRWIGHGELSLKIKRMQPKTSIDNMINKGEYIQMLEFAKRTNKKKMYHIMKTIALSGIRVGELKHITVSSVRAGVAEVYNKGKYRNIYISKHLAEELLKYCEDNGIQSGIIFHGRSREQGISTVGVWKNMKYIASKVDIPLEKVYPHSLRHLFAKTYMENVGDVTELSDLLGHSRLETTWIYTKTTSEEKRNRLEKLDL